MAAITGVSYIEDDDGNAASNKTTNKTNTGSKPSLTPVPPANVVPQSSLDSLVLWCKEHNVSRETVKGKSDDLFGLPVSALSLDQFNDLRQELDKLAVTVQ